MIVDAINKFQVWVTFVEIVVELGFQMVPWAFFTVIKKTTKYMFTFMVGVGFQMVFQINQLIVFKELINYFSSKT